MACAGSVAATIAENAKNIKDPQEVANLLGGMVTDYLYRGKDTEGDPFWNVLAVPQLVNEEEAVKAARATKGLSSALLHVLTTFYNVPEVLKPALAVLGVVGTDDRGAWWESDAEEIGNALGRVGNENLETIEICRFVAVTTQRLSFNHREKLIKGTRDMLLTFLKTCGQDELTVKWSAFAISNLSAKHTENQNLFLAIPELHTVIRTLLDKYTWDKGACRALVMAIGNLTCDNKQNADAFHGQEKGDGKLEMAFLLHRVLRVHGFDIDMICPTFTTIANVVFRDDKHGWAFLEQGSRFTDEVKLILNRYCGLDKNIEPNPEVVRCGAFMVFRMTIRNAMWAMAARHRVVPQMEMALERFRDHDDMVFWVEKALQELERFK